MTSDDPVEWMRNRWHHHGLPGEAHFAAMAALMRTHALMTAEIERVLKDVDLTRTSYLVLITLKMSRDGVRPLGQLSKHLMVHPTTVTMVVDQLEKAELVARQPHPSDRRTILASITKKGNKAAQQASVALAAVDFGLTGSSVAQAKGLTEDLYDIRLAVGDIDVSKAAAPGETA